MQQIAVFIQHWPVYLQKPGQNYLGEDFIKSDTILDGSWEQAAQIPPRAIDFQDLDTGLMSGVVAGILEQKGYQVFLANPPLAGKNETIASLMVQDQQNHSPVDAFIFCYFAPTLFISHAQEVPEDHTRRS